MICGGDVVALWLVCWTLDPEVRVQALAGSLCCVLGQDTTLTVPLSSQEYKWVPVNCQGNLTKCWGTTCDGLASHPGEIEILLFTSCYRNWDKHWQLWAMVYTVGLEDLPL